MKRSSLRVELLIFATIVNSCALATARAQTSSDPDPRAFIQKARTSLVLVSGEDRDGKPVAPGLGFVIEGNLIATDQQIVRSAARVRVRTTGQDSDTEVKSRDNYQLASVLRVAAAQREPLMLGDSDKVAVNDKVFIAADLQGSVLETVVTRIGTIDGKRSFVLDAPIAGANRGGPVFNRRGEVIGVAAENPEQQDHGLAIPSAYLKILQSFGQAGVGMGAGTGPRDPLPSTGPGYGPGVFQGPKPDDQPRTGPSSSVDSRPVLLKSAAPQYTEQARNNKVQGIVKMRVLVGEDGKAQQVRIIQGLPDGLDEQAIAAVRRSTFKPAMKDGQAVPYWLSLSIEFNLR